MARRPARLERAGALTPRDRVWSAIRSLAGERCHGTFCVAEVHFLVNLKGEPIHADTIDSYLRGLAAAQPPYIEKLAEQNRYEGRRRSELHLHLLIRDVGVDAPRVTKDGRPVTQGAGNELMWTAMKALHEFDHAELAAAAAAGAVKVSDETAKTYCTWLARAGYLALAAPSNGPHKARYRFNRAKNTGPRAPLVTKQKEVIDGNTGVVVWERPKGEKGCQDRT